MTEIPAIVGPLVTSRKARPCPTYFEVASPSNPGLSALVFKNHYCHRVSVKQGRRVGDHKEWVTVLLDFPLMKDPHHEADAQDWHVLPVNLFSGAFDPTLTTAPLRIYLHQPSPMWATVELRHVKTISGCLPSGGAQCPTPDRATSKDLSAAVAPPSADRFAAQGRPPAHESERIEEDCRKLSAQLQLIRTAGD